MTEDVLVPLLTYACTFSEREMRMCVFFIHRITITSQVQMFDSFLKEKKMEGIQPTEIALNMPP